MLDDDPFTLTPGRPVPKTLVEGAHTVSIPSLSVPAQSFTVSTNFFARPFLSRLFIVNPDQVAVLTWELMEYSENPKASDEYKFEMHTNALFHEFENINFRFEEFPDEIETEGSRALRRRVDVLTGYEPAELIAPLAENLSQDALAEHFKRRFHYRPEEYVYLGVLSSFLDAGSFVAEIQNELAMRPVLMEVHRVYQSTREQAEPDYDLEAEYAEHLAKEPENTDMIYLLARVTRDRDESLSLFRRAAEADPPNAHALNALAVDLLAVGQFEEAKLYSDKALALLPDNPLFATNRREIRLARGEYAALLEEVEQDGGGMPASYADAQEQVRLMTLNGMPPEEVRKHILKYVALEARKGLPEGLRPMVAESLTLSHVYAVGDRQRTIELMTDPEDPEGMCQAALLAGNYEEAGKLLEGLASPSSDDHFLVFMQAAQAGQTERAEQHLETAVRILTEQGDVDAKYAAACLAGKEEPDLERLLHISMWPSGKRVLMAALGVRFPEHRAACFDLARKLNYDVTYPHFVLKDLLGAEGGAAVDGEPAPLSEEDGEGAEGPTKAPATNEPAPVSP
jgi:Flp pilus assembly protein TadD